MLVGLLLLLFLFGLAPQLAQIEPALGDRVQRLALEFREQPYHPLVHAVDHQQHFDTQLPEDLEVRAVPRRGLSPVM